MSSIMYHTCFLRCDPEWLVALVELRIVGRISGSCHVSHVKVDLAMSIVKHVVQNAMTFSV